MSRTRLFTRMPKGYRNNKSKAETSVTTKGCPAKRVTRSEEMVTTTTKGSEKATEEAPYILTPEALLAASMDLHSKNK